jgi:Domain of unknown function (DUF4276)
VTRVYVVVEGQTEESFVKNVLAGNLWKSNVHLTPILLGPAGHKGGRTSYARVKRDVLLLLKQDREAYCSTMIDLYGLGAGFPRYPPPQNLSNIAKVQYIENAVKDDICEEVPELRPDVRFIPYLQLHEYEALLFSDPTAFADGINHPGLAHAFQNVCNAFDSPEDINDNPTTAPSKRVLAVCPSYRKVIEGTRAAIAVGMPRMREQCRHFREWIGALESLAAR